MPARANLSMADWAGEISSVSVNIEPVTSATIVNVLAEVAALKDAIEDVTRGVFLGQEVTTQLRFNGTGTRSNQEEADRETKWLVTYQDATAELSAGVPNPGYFKVFSFEIPTANTSLRFDGDTVYTKGGALPAAPWDALIAAIEDVVKSPYGGDAEVLEIRSVGRNL